MRLTTCESGVRQATFSAAQVLRCKDLYTHQRKTTQPLRHNACHACSASQAFPSRVVPAKQVYDGEGGRPGHRIDKKRVVSLIGSHRTSFLFLLRPAPDASSVEGRWRSHGTRHASRPQRCVAQGDASLFRRTHWLRPGWTHRVQRCRH